MGLEILNFKTQIFDEIFDVNLRVRALFLFYLRQILTDLLDSFTIWIFWFFAESLCDFLLTNVYRTNENSILKLLTIIARGFGGLQVSAQRAGVSLLRGQTYRTYSLFKILATSHTAYNCRNVALTSAPPRRATTAEILCRFVVAQRDKAPASASRNAINFNQSIKNVIQKIPNTISASVSNACGHSLVKILIHAIKN